MNTRSYNLLIDALLSLETKNDMKVFLDGLLTQKEREEIPIRLEIVKLLKKGVAQHKIASKLGVGIATVSRGSKELAKGNFSPIWR